MIWLMLTFLGCKSCLCIEPSLNTFQQDHPYLVKYVREHVLEPPPKYPNTIEEMDLFIEDSDFYFDSLSLQGQYGQAPFLEDLFRPLMSVENTTKRFFIEAGAYDGILGSNTLRLELNPMWTGLLVEPNPDLYKITKSRGRNCWTSPSCISTKPHSEIVDFDAAGQIGGIINTANKKLPGDGYGHVDRKTITLQCIPLYTTILALGK